MNEPILGDDGVRLAVSERGSGPPLVFCHGGLADGRQSEAMTRCLGDVARSISFDARGRGSSTRDVADHSLGALVADLARVVSDRCEDPPIVGGGSLGAAVSLRYALDEAGPLRALVQVWPAYGPDGPSEGGRRFVGSVRDAAAAYGLEGWRRALSSDRWGDDVAGWAGSFTDDDFVAACDAMLDARPFSSWTDLGRIEVPTFVIPGDDDVHPPGIAEDLLRALPNGSAGHGTTEDHVCAEIRRFLEALRP